MKSRFFNKLLDRLDRIDPGSLQSHFLRLAREKGLMETILQAVREGIIVVNDQGVVFYTNDATCRLLGVEQSRIEGERIDQFIPGIDWHGIFKMDSAEWSRLISREMETVHPERRFLEFYVVPLAVADPQEGGALIILRDVTRAREHADKTIESERVQAITLLAASVAHEIGNPLNSLTIHLQLLERELKELGAEPPLHLLELVAVSRQEINRLDQIITQFLRALRPAPVNLHPLHLDDALRQALDFMRAEIENRAVKVRLTVEDNPPPALADADQMRQAFFNIIKNAIQAMDHGGVLDIEARSNDRSVVISFKDSGPGLSREQMGHLFEPFQSTKREGSGLGLMIVHRIIRDHGGSIEVHSEPDHGATLVISIPRADRAALLLKAHRPGTEGERP